MKVDVHVIRCPDLKGDGIQFILVPEKEDPKKLKSFLGEGCSFIFATTMELLPTDERIGLDSGKAIQEIQSKGHHLCGVLTRVKEKV